MGLFGPSKIRITPGDFVRTQLDSLFSAQFAAQQSDEFSNLSRSIHLLQKVAPETYVREKLNVVFNLLQLAWDRNTPYGVFIQSSSIMLDDPRVKGVNSGVYRRCLSRAQQAGMDTFGLIADVFISQLLPGETGSRDPDIAKLHDTYGTEFTGLYISYEALMKRCKFVT
jgi:hypothetical protein